MVRERVSIKEAPLLGLLVLWLIALCIAFNGLGNVALRDFDEATVARVAYEFTQKSGLEILLPSLWGEPYLNKPPGLHWIIAILVKLNTPSASGILPSEFIVRLGPAFLSTLVVPLGGLFQWYLNPKEKLPAICTSSILLTLLPIARHGRLAMLDGTQLSAICLFWLLLISLDNSKTDKYRLLLAGLVCSFMLLLKAPLLIPAVIAALIAKSRNGITLKFPFSRWLLLGLSPGIVWHSWNSLNYGSGALRLWLGDGVSRVLFDAGEGSDLGFLVPIIEIIEGGWPWLILLPFGANWAWQNRNTTWGRWSISTTIVMSISIFPLKTQLPWYSHPLWLPFSILCGPILAGLINRKPSKLFHNLNLKYIPYVFLVLGTLGPLLYFLGDFKLGIDAKEYFLISIFLGSGWFSGGILLSSSKKSIREIGLISIILGSTLGLFVLMGNQNWNWEINEQWDVKPIAKMINSQSASNIKIKGWSARPSLNWYTEQEIKIHNEIETKPHWILSNSETDSESIPVKNTCLKKASFQEWNLLYCK